MRGRTAFAFAVLLSATAAKADEEGGRVEQRKVAAVTLPAPGPTASTSGAAATSHAVPVGAYVLGGIAIALLGTALYFKLSMDSDVNNLRETCAPNCPAAARDAVSAKLESTNVSFAAGLLAVAGAVTWAWLGSGGSKGARATVGVRPTSSGALMDVAAFF
jgi:hypothetical protein